MTARFRNMSVTASTPEVQSDLAAPTLGDVLYPDPGKLRPTEAMWVALVRSISAGDQTAFAELYARSHRLVFTLTMRIVRNSATAEELTLDVFHDVWRRASSYEERNGTVIGWLMNQARSRAIDRVRYETRQKRTDPSPETEPIASADIGSDERLQRLQRDERVRFALAVLTPDERRAIETAFFGECTYAEVASRLDQPPGTIKTRIRSGLSKLRDELGREGGET